MLNFLKPQPFIQRGENTYFRRGRAGPVYIVNDDEQKALFVEVNSLRKKMIILIFSFLMLFVFTIFLLPQILDLNFAMALIVVTFLLIFSFLPFFLLVRFNLGHQKRIRTILAGAEATMLPPAVKEETNRAPWDEQVGVNTNRLIILFLLGVAITTVGVVMLIAGGDMPFKKQLIWWMNVLTGSMLTGLGFYGLLKKKSGDPNQPTPPRDDQGDQP